MSKYPASKPAVLRKTQTANWKLPKCLRRNTASARRRGINKHWQKSAPALREQNFILCHHNTKTSCVYCIAGHTKEQMNSLNKTIVFIYILWYTTVMLQEEPRMNLDYLRYFVKLAEVRHYTRAAEQLCISQPSLSHAIRQLETELGVPLFEKNGRNTALTRFGTDFLSCAQRTLAALDDGVTALQKSARGEGLIRLGFCASSASAIFRSLPHSFWLQIQKSTFSLISTVIAPKRCSTDFPRRRMIWYFAPNLHPTCI